ncbi:hypothetical protein TH53_18570 [Pedobacter lusitanus]|uniref:FecR protein n=1 Tax=Pedobacter lusitanus TaxID=1503925 RepID=A0A0D0GES8_9SPHI|nr:FecR family protein [Pedobacter lusitanus]KIO75792.1 hypothetical protein TH53_18570 [Pedobacter lusitanus]
MKDKEILQQQLAEKWLNGTITAEEKIQFAAYYNSNSQLPLDLGHEEQVLNKKMFQEILLQIRQEKSAQKPSFVKKYWPYAAAAAVLAGILSLVILNQSSPIAETYTGTNKLYQNDVGPGGNAARLTLSNGATIILNEASTGHLSAQTGVDVIKMNNGLLQYKQSTGNDKTLSGINTLTTPKGGQYELLLADGTRVSLNASSSISFPVQFSGKNRIVELKGEAYFEVAKNKNKPFIVHTDRGNIEVLGTHFNVASYPDENRMTATLLEGSVKVSNQHNSSLIIPGEQANVNQKITVCKADIDQVMAWKNKLFIFDQATIREVMLQLERWYDIEVVFKGNIPEGSFSGEISRNIKLSEVLKVLQSSDINFKIEGKKVIISQ